MKAPGTPQIHELLPELFNQPNPRFTIGGMCTPETGCAPAPGTAQTDLLKILTQSVPTPRHRQKVETAEAKREE